MYNCTWTVFRVTCVNDQCLINYSLHVMALILLSPDAVRVGRDDLGSGHHLQCELGGSRPPPRLAVGRAAQ